MKEAEGGGRDFDAISVSSDCEEIQSTDRAAGLALRIAERRKIVLSDLDLLARAADGPLRSESATT